MNKDGKYLVKDSSNGSSYYVAPEQLDKAVADVRNKTSSGGVLTVEKDRSGASTQQLADEGKQHARELGDKPGTGTNSRRNYGSESA